MLRRSSLRLVWSTLVLGLALGACFDPPRMEVALPSDFLGPPPPDAGVDVLEDVAKDAGDTSADVPLPDALPDGLDVPDAVVDADVTEEDGDIGGDACPPGETCEPCTLNDDCTKLDDGNLCNGRWVCLGSICVEEPDPVECEAPVPANPCGSYGCFITTGECGYLPLPEGTACDDGDPCSVGDHCVTGGCTGGPVIRCDDGNPCTLDTCEDGKCAYVGADGGECDDGNLCTASDLCSGGVCGSPTSNCECESDGDCAPYDDGNPCTGTVACVGLKCRVTPDSVPKCGDEAGACQTAYCDLAQGCVVESAPDGTGCDDGDPCTAGGVCNAGSCEAGEVLECGGPLCGTGSCGEAGCEIVLPEEGACECAADADCEDKDDAKACTGKVICFEGQCIVDMEDVPDCSQAANNPCVACDDDGTTCTLVTTADGESCDDGNACSEGDACQGGSCGGTPVDCPGGDSCSEAICHPLSGCAVITVGRPCDDGSACTSETCHTGVCTTYFEKTCPVPGECLAAACDPGNGQCKETAAEGACDDLDACTQSDACSAGECSGTPAFCDDGNACTDNACDSATGCTFTNNTFQCDDGTECTQGEACVDGECTTVAGVCVCQSAQDCVPFANGDPCLGPLACVDGLCVPNPDKVVVCDATGNTICLESVCLFETGECAMTPRADGKACDDGDGCTIADVCASGACEGQGLDCDDDNPCTSDSCDGDACAHLPVAAAELCDDGNSCTTDTVCVAGACGAGENSCECVTDAECAVFDDGNRCNGEVKCLGGQCELDPSSIIVCDPSQDPCRDVICVAATGACQFADANAGKLCEDGDACTVDDSCTGGKCGGSAASCDDASACTIDDCNAVDGGCLHKATEGVCNDGNTCTSVDLCEIGVCSGTANTCVCELDADCDDYGLNKCVSSYECVDGGCVPVPGTAVDCTSDNDTACSFNQCEPATGVCTPTILTEGTECDDENICTVQEYCDAAGECIGAAVGCEDGNPCTDSNCDPATGCDPQSLPEEAPCDDGDECTDDEACYGGICTTQSSACSCQINADCPVVEDQCLGSYTCLGGKCAKGEDIVCSVNPNPCRLNVCDPDQGQCTIIDAPSETSCTDGDLCTLDDYCYNGICTGNVNKCDDGNPCTLDECSAGICINESTEGLPCDDGDKCTTLEKCKNGVCGTGVFVCSCSVDVQCKVFDDGDTCNGIWACQDKVCVEDLSSEVICLDDPDDCVKATCHPVLGTCLTQSQPDGAPCDDGTICTSEDQCFQGGCIGTPPLNCPDDDQADCKVPTCHPELGTCQPAPILDATECDDGDACTHDDACSAGWCLGALSNCDDGSACTVDDCSQDLGCINTPQFGSCEDGNPCTEETICNAGACGAGVNVCGCAEDADCADYQVDPCADVWACANGSCAAVPDSALVCDPSVDPCLASVCDPGSGACEESPTPDHTSCDDGDICTNQDRCDSGSCGGTPKSCDDGNSCTIDTCAADGSCEYSVVLSGTDCDDGVACNGDDTCAKGACVASGEASCPCAGDGDCAAFEDGNACNGSLVCGADSQCGVDAASIVSCADDPEGCYTSTCDVETGACENLPALNGQACDDGDLCTTGDSCQIGSCVSAPTGCDDGDPCTVDSCDADFGCLHYGLGGPCDDGDPCTVNTSCDDGECKGVPNPCDDGVFCTNDGCVEASGCVHVPKSPLFTCDDNNLCTVLDKCNEGACVGQNQCGCSDDADCEANDDGNLCFGPLSCVGGECVRDPANFVLCPASEDCQYWTCGADTGECSPNAFKEGEDCDDDDACIENTTCSSGACVGDPIDCDEAVECQEVICDQYSGCQKQDLVAACDDGSFCTDDDRCIAGACVGLDGNPYDTGFEEGAPAGWTFSTTGNATAWVVSGFKVFEGALALYGGNATTGNMNDVPASGYSVKANMPSIDLGLDVETAVLKFLLYLDVEDQGCAADFVSVRVNGSEIYSRCQSTGGVFVPVEIDLDIFIGAEVVISFVLNSVDENNNNGIGAVIDRVDFERSCAEGP